VEYTEAQQAAIVTIDDPLLIVACAGSGKTQVISQRIVEILRRPDVRPGNIVAFTFTEKAAAELKERVTNLVTAEFGNVIGLAELYIGTMHGYALDALQTHVAETFKYGVLDEIQTRLLIDRHSRASGLTTTDAIVNGQPKKLRRYVNSRLYMQVTNILREDDVDRILLSDELTAALNGYRELLHRLRYFDYTELLRMAVDLLAEDEQDPVRGPARPACPGRHPVRGGR
jgi:DNA helicase-2/ATP-dependent DNA helicase PcrA